MRCHYCNSEVTAARIETRLVTGNRPGGGQWTPVAVECVSCGNRGPIEWFDYDYEAAA